jgi:NADH-quinone oxidoreductase subunit E
MATNDSGFFTCRNTCWIVGGLLGLAVFLLIGQPWGWAIIVGLIVAVAVALILQRVFCSDIPASAGTPQRTEDTPSPAKDPAATAVSTAAAGAATSTAPRAADAASSAGTGDVDAAAAKPAPATEASAAEQAAEDAPGTESEADRAATAKDTGSKPEPAAKDPTEASIASQEAEPSPDPIIQPSKELPGQRELEARKGDWKYEKPADAKSAAKKKPAAQKAEPAAAPAAGAEPELLDAPKGGVADDLKMIRGVGPGIEKKLHDAGVFHFDQIATWTAAEIAAMDDKLSFRGRIARDDWVTQAKQLASGEETEFSKRASSSGLYDENKKK